MVDREALDPPGFEVIECTERELDKLPRPWVNALLDAVHSAHSTPYDTPDWRLTALR